MMAEDLRSKKFEAFEEYMESKGKRKKPAAKKKGKTEVNERQMTLEDIMLFKEAKVKEWNSWLSNKVIQRLKRFT